MQQTDFHLIFITSNNSGVIYYMLFSHLPDEITKKDTDTIIQLTTYTSVTHSQSLLFVIYKHKVFLVRA